MVLCCSFLLLCPCSHMGSDSQVMSSSVSPKEFTVFMRLLFSMNKFKNGVEGANEILDFVHASIDLDKDFSATA